jgi:hypothetical protein
VARLAALSRAGPERSRSEGGASDELLRSPWVASRFRFQEDTDLTCALQTTGVLQKK